MCFFILCYLLYFILFIFQLQSGTTDIPGSSATQSLVEPQLSTPGDDVTESIDNRRRGRKRKSINPDEIMISAFNILKATSERNQSIQSLPMTTRALDENDNFGAFIANKLRAYTQHKRTYVQHHIQCR
jgi:hypothetical protein